MNKLTEKQIDFLATKGYLVESGKAYWKNGSQIVLESALIAQIKAQAPKETQCTSDSSIALSIITSEIEGKTITLDWSVGFTYTK